jgi:hypothetical protein
MMLDVEAAEESGREEFGLELWNEPRRQGGGGKETIALTNRLAIDGPVRTVEQRKKEDEKETESKWGTHSSLLDPLEAAVAPE